MKVYIFAISLAFLLVSCSSLEESHKPIIQSKLIENNMCPVGMNSIYATGTKITIDCIPFVDQNPIRTISAEVNYDPQKNLINLSDEESEKVVKKLLEKQNQEIKKQNKTGALIQGSWKAVYNPPKYPDGYDSITVTFSGKQYTLPGLYRSEERAQYLENIRAGTGCIAYVQGPNPEQGTPNVLINGIYYYPPDHGNCMSGLRTFGFFDSFSPSGHYLTYRVYGWEWSEVRMIDISTGNNILDKTYDSQSMRTWTPDNKQMLYFSEGWDNSPAGIYLTRVGDFPHADKILEPRIGLVSIDIDEKYLYTLELYQDYYLRILDRTNYKEVYTRIVKK